MQRLVRNTAGATARPVARISEGYELIDEVGRGATGIVYRAKQPGIDRTVAIKMLVTGATASPVELARFRRESAALGRLDHPQIVKVYDVGEQDGVPFLAMEWIAGTTLADYLRETTLSPVAAAELVCKLAGGIEHAHRQGVLHRDLKPHNVLVAVDDENEVRPLPDANLDRFQWQTNPEFRSLKICDFGLARFSEAEGFQTQLGQTLGTPSYMAPSRLMPGTRRFVNRQMSMDWRYPLRVFDRASPISRQHSPGNGQDG